MRLGRLIPAVCILSVSILCVSAQAFAQSWIEYTNLEDRFSVNFPGEPTVEDTTYTSQYEAEYPARIRRINHLVNLECRGKVHRFASLVHGGKRDCLHLAAA